MRSGDPVTPQQVAILVKHLQSAHQRALDLALARLEITVMQWGALRHLDENPSASLHDLAVLTLQTDQGAGLMAARMVDLGMIERVPGPGRAVRHRLTATGLKLRRAGEKIVDKVVTRSFQSFSPVQMQQLAALLEQAIEDAAH